jgi:hypothetical protein
MASNEVVFNFDGLTQHERLIVRARVFTECASASVTMILGESSPVTEMITPDQDSE